MTMRLRACVFGALAPLALMAACGERETVTTVLASVDADWRPPPLPTGFTVGATCEPLGTYRGPEPGSTFVYRRADGSLSSREVIAVQLGRVEFLYRDLAQPDLEPLPPRHALAGMLVTYAPGNASRSVEYSIDPLTVLRDLTPGAVVSIPTVETSTLRGRAGRVSFPTTITYRTCGVLGVEGASHPVRVYDVASARRVLDRSGDRVREGHVTYFLSDRWGYPLAFQDEVMTVAVRMVGPGRTIPTPAAIP